LPRADARATIDRVPVPSITTELLTFSDDVYGRLHDRVAGLTDDEYFWEPADDCMTVRRQADGRYLADNDARPEFPPPAEPRVTTIAWRLAHITTLLSDDRNAHWLGLPPTPGAYEPPTAATAADAIATLERAYAVFRSYVDAATDEGLWQTMGEIAGPYHDATRIGFVLHELDEFVHHGAEIGLLRDLYRASGRSSSL
jgi:DinB family protein